MNGAVAVAAAVTLAQFLVLRLQVAGLSGAAVAVAVATMEQRHSSAAMVVEVCLVDRAVMAIQTLLLARMALPLRVAVVAPNLLMVATVGKVAVS
jgi:hypothetical protein